MSLRRSIPTRYRGILFRSKLEADWARTFDALDIPWEYEREGRYFGDVFYLPDFWLPRAGQFFEVKGVVDDTSIWKAMAVVRHSGPHPTLAGDWWEIHVPIVFGFPGGVLTGLARVDGRPVTVQRTTLFSCEACSGWWFGSEEHSFRCACCGAHDGDHHLGPRYHRAVTPFPLHPTRNIEVSCQ